MFGAGDPVGGCSDSLLERGAASTSWLESRLRDVFDSAGVGSGGVTRASELALGPRCRLDSSIAAGSLEALRVCTGDMERRAKDGGKFRVATSGYLSRNHRLHASDLGSPSNACHTPFAYLSQLQRGPAHISLAQRTRQSEIRRTLTQSRLVQLTAKDEIRE